MYIIVYQSLNSSSSKSHNPTASHMQPFTKKTHQFYQENAPKNYLSLPTIPEYPTAPVYGPAHLINTASTKYLDQARDANTMRESFKEKMLQNLQNIIRKIGPHTILSVFGEVDSSNTDWNNVIMEIAGKHHETATQIKTCNCFSVHTHDINGVTKLSSGFGYAAWEWNKLVVLSVHVPNAICSNQDSMIKFYTNIKKLLGIHTIDVIIGDTNQPSDGFTQKVLNDVFQNQFTEVNPDKTPYDIYNFVAKGTNSTSTKTYDVAFYNNTTVTQTESLYLSQQTPIEFGGSSVSAAITDHMGIALGIKKGATLES